MWHLVLEGDRLLRWLEAYQQEEPSDLSRLLGEGLLRLIRDEEAGPQVAQHFKDTVRVLCCGSMWCALPGAKPLLMSSMWPEASVTLAARFNAGRGLGHPCCQV
jgi:hypothetical protein